MLLRPHSRSVAFRRLKCRSFWVQRASLSSHKRISISYLAWNQPRDPPWSTALPWELRSGQASDVLASHVGVRSSVSGAEWAASCGQWWGQPSPQVLSASGFWALLALTPGSPRQGRRQRAVAVSQRCSAWPGGDLCVRAAQVSCVLQTGKSGPCLDF